ncbi:putative disease resistance RPP13-like protein 1 [Oryza glaberrima]|uniref:putative disease resistance RPP13-like protein 1 n=1 Tax=Oryza glaberrima TaxID=4538 RepID=UPI00224C1BF1|nr:putative disease resistance RPP13-like protein 1 [Oryza glaberrima]
MAGLFASLAVRRALDTLTSFLPASLVASSSSGAARAREEQDLEDLRMLERTMRRIHATLNDAEQLWDIREETTKLQLKELKELAYDMEDVVDEYEYEVNRCKVEALELSASAASNKRKHQTENEALLHDLGIVAVPEELATKTRKLIERFHEIKYYSDNFTLTDNDGERRVAPNIGSFQKTSSVVFEKSILGREKDKDKIVEKLLSMGGDNIASPIFVLAIVGMGGIGKTTLAQLVYNDSKMRESIDKHAWVCVSQPFDVTNITKSIISSLKKDRCDLSELAILQEILLRQIKGKKVFLVLDDVWNERSDFWELLCIPMRSTKLCNIVVTTRSESVARLVQTMPDFYSLNCLSSYDSWLLFKQFAFPNQDSGTPANLVEIGRDIVRKCKGLPLAIKTVGSMLHCEANETAWRNVAESELWDLEQIQNEILPSLHLSYKHMPLYLKRCFAALSLFPKDYQLEDSLVVHLWEYLDLLQSDRNDIENKTGYLYFNELVQRSFLQEYDAFRYTMHDLFHDLACFLAGEDFFRLEGKILTEIPPNTRYMSLFINCRIDETLVAPISLRSFVIFGKTGFGDFMDVDTFLLNCKKLRNLSMVCKPSMAFPDFIGGLKLLRRLSVLPPLFGFKIIRCTTMPQLYNLHDLHLNGTHAVLGFGKLIKLQTLEVYVTRYGCNCNIRELRNLNEVRNLTIYGLDNVAHIEDASKAQLQNKRHLESLSLQFSNVILDCGHVLEPKPVAVSHEKVLHNLRPHHNLRKLHIYGYNSPIFPSWLGNASFLNMTELDLQCSECHKLPTLGELPSLRFLRLAKMKNLQHIGRELCSNVIGVKGFPSLTALSINFMPGWYKWSGVVDGDFSCLRSLTIFDAQKLRSIPLALFMSVITLCLWSCGNLHTFPASHNLIELRITECDGLTELPALPSLVELNIKECPNLCTIGSLPSLLELQIHKCPNLSVVGSLPSLTTINLKDPQLKDEALYSLLNVIDHPSLNCITIICETMADLNLEPQRLSSLKKLRLCCPNLQYCHGLSDLTFLEEIKIWGCPNLPTDGLLQRLQQSLDVQKNAGVYDVAHAVCDVYSF